MFVEEVDLRKFGTDTW